MKIHSFGRVLLAAMAVLLVFASMTTPASAHTGYNSAAGVHAAGPADTPPDPMAPTQHSANTTSTSTPGEQHATPTWRSPFRASATASAVEPTAAAPPLKSSS